MVTHGIAVLIKSGRIANQQEVNKYLVSKKDGWHLLNIKKPSTEITIQQHRFYRGVVLAACQTAIHDAGQGMWPVDDIHEELKKRFGVRRFILGGKSEVIKGMASYKKDDFSEYLERIKGWLFDPYGVVLPDPEDYDFN